jgi:hypothetical protein
MLQQPHTRAFELCLSTSIRRQQDCICAWSFVTLIFFRASFACSIAVVVGFHVM